MRFILASASHSRKLILNQQGFSPEIIPANICEVPLKKESPRDFVMRMAIGKAEKISEEINKNCVVLGSDNIVTVGRRILHKPALDSEVRKSLELISGKNHCVISAMCVIQKKDNVIRKIKKITKTRIKIKHLTKTDIDLLVNSKQGIGAVGGYRIGKLIDGFILNISGTTSTVAGLSAYNVRNALISFGIMPSANEIHEEK